MGHSACWLMHHWVFVALETELGSIVYCCWAEMEERKVAVAARSAVEVFIVMVWCVLDVFVVVRFVVLLCRQSHVQSPLSNSCRVPKVSTAGGTHVWKSGITTEYVATAGAQRRRPGMMCA